MSNELRKENSSMDLVFAPGTDAKIIMEYVNWLAENSGQTD